MKNLIRYSLSIMLAAAWLNGLSQQVKTIDVIQARMDSARARQPIEKLYLHTDRSAYTTADTLWFKVYLWNADYLTASRRSGVLYVELGDEEGRCIKRTLVPLNYGLSWGNIPLTEKGITEGNYILRAYTNWMRNFGDDYIFTRKITITDPADQPSLVDANFTSLRQAGERKVEGKLALRTLQKQPLRLKDMRVKVINDKKPLFDEKLNTGFDGLLKFDFTLPADVKAKKLRVVTTDIGKNSALAPATVPVLLKDKENADLQFMPEGGDMVAGALTRIGFKAIAESGEGINIDGRIVNKQGNEVARFASLHKGMGSFEMTPERGQAYTAEIPLPDGKWRKVPLPAVADAGSGLRIEDAGDSLRVSIFTAGVQGVHYLVGQARGVICYIERTELKEGKLFRMVSKSAFPSGIVRFTLTNTTQKPLNERIVFINHHDGLKISLATGKTSYLVADSIAVKISVKDKNGKPVQGSFSVAVTDDSQVGADSLGSRLANYLLLTSDLKGTVEEPGFYFNDAEPAAIKALDNLLLTQGWVGYKWDDVLKNMPEFKFAAEPVYAVQGTVVNITNKPVAGAPLVMISKSPPAIIEAVSDANGRFRFEDVIPVDTASYMIQAKNKRGKSFNVDIEIDRFQPPVFGALNQTFLPWYVNPNAAFVNAVNNAITREAGGGDGNGGGRMLNEVKIKAKKNIKGSQSPFSNAEIMLDDADMQQRDGLNLWQMLKNDVEGFGETVIWIKPKPWAPPEPIFTVSIRDVPVAVLVDGISIARYFTAVASDKRGYVKYMENALSRFMASDIVGIEVFKQFGLIYVTTRMGVGPFVPKTPGVVVYRPMAVNSYKEFYRPRYQVKTADVKYDLRSTIHWEPNIVTDKDGNALVNFYAAGKPSTYTVKIEGADMQGQIGGLYDYKLTVR